MKAISLMIGCGAFASANQTALRVPQYGDEVLMLGTDVANKFKSLNTLSIKDIDKVLAFYISTVAYESAAPTGFRYDRGFLVKDPPPNQIATSCTTPRPGAGVTNGAVPASSSPTGLPSTITQAQTVTRFFEEPPNVHGERLLHHCSSPSRSSRLGELLRPVIDIHSHDKPSGRKTLSDFETTVGPCLHLYEVEAAPMSGMSFLRQ